MNVTSFLQCLAVTGINTGTYPLGLYNFQSGNKNFVQNLLYSTGFNYVSGFPLINTIPLIFEGMGAQKSGIFAGQQSYQVANQYTEDFGLLLFLNNSGCLHVQNFNQILVSTILNLSGGNSGIIMGLTPSNRLYINVTGGFSQTLPTEIDIFDLVFLSVEQNRFVNFGSFNLKTNTFYRDTYDYGNTGINIQNLLIGGALSYPPNTTGYSGIIKEAYLFNSNIIDPYLTSVIDCVFCTGFNYTPTTGIYFQKQITGSYWSGVSGFQNTGQVIISGNYMIGDGSNVVIFFSSGLSGFVNLYSGLFSQSLSIPYTGISSGIYFVYNTGQIMSGLISNLYFGVPLTSGDMVEVYTYIYPVPNLGLPIGYSSQFPASSQSIQLYGNGLAETSGLDFSLIYGNYILGYDTNDTLLYDIIPSSITMPYISGYISTGVGTATYTLITGISGISMTGFNYDIYLDGQKMASGVNYTYTSPNLLVSGNDLADIADPNDAPEIKFIPLFPYLMRNLIQIQIPSGTSQNTIGTITGYTEQVWLNGLRQTLNLDYFKVNTCPFCSGFYYDPQFSFALYESIFDNINLFNIPAP